MNNLKNKFSIVKTNLDNSLNKIKKSGENLKNKLSFVNDNRDIIEKISALIIIVINIYYIYRFYTGSFRKNRELYNLKLENFFTIYFTIFYTLPQILVLFGVRNKYLDSFNSYLAYFELVNSIYDLFLLLTGQSRNLGTIGFRLSMGIARFFLALTSPNKMKKNERLLAPTIYRLIDLVIESSVIREFKGDKPILNFGQNEIQQKQFLKTGSTHPWINNLLDESELKKSSFFEKTLFRYVLTYYGLYLPINYYGGKLIESIGVAEEKNIISKSNDLDDILDDMIHEI